MQLADHILTRPQPIEIFPLPAGYLLLPPETDRELLTNLLAGATPDVWPAEWKFFVAALTGDTASAVSSLNDGPLAAYNRFVLAPSTDHYVVARVFAPLRTLTDVVAFSLGYIDQPPAVDDLDGELLAHALAAHAAHALSENDPVAAVQHLERGIAAARTPSPLLAAQLIGQLAAVLRDDPARASEAVALYQEAIQLAGETPLVRLRAELWLALGVTHQEQSEGRRGVLLEAVKAYQQAIACGLSAESHADLYAEVQNNLGLAYLSIPQTTASDQLRMAVAVQSFREALKVFTKETHADRWASTTLNLANALQYVPSGHQVHNLLHAAELYDEVLAVRTRAADPLGYARVLANQANALAHLGQFSSALEKLNEAHKLFHWYEQPDAAASVMELVAQITTCREQAAATIEG